MFDAAIRDLKLHREILSAAPPSRELSLALTKLDEAIMWLEAGNEG